ncbi:hypothetical protein D3C85_1813410 [compost metagenome]
MSRFDDFPQQGHKTWVTDPAANRFHQQAMMHSVKVAGQVTFNHPAGPGFSAIGKLQLYRSDHMVDATFRPETI